MRSFRRPRSDSYEANLSTEEREQLYVLLLKPGLSLKQVTLMAPPWRSGRRAGRKPDSQAVGKVSRRIRIESTLGKLQDIALARQVVLAQLLQHVSPGKLHDEMTDLAMRLISQQVIDDTLEQLNPSDRTDAAKLLLRRSDQHLNREKFELALRKYQDEAKAADEKAKAEGITRPKGQGIPSEVLAQIEQELKLL